MSKTTPISPEAQIDMRLAGLYYEARKINQDIARAQHTIIDAAGAKYYYRGRKRVTDMTFEEARSIVEAELATIIDDHGYARLVSGSNADYSRKALAKLEESEEALRCNQAEMASLEDQYTGWSRFFLVTSSIGHIHSSMSCSTCRYTTQFGWLPNLSGKDEATAVEQCGPALCTVCFPSAPTENTLAKLTKKQAEDILAGKKIEAKPAEEFCPGSGRHMPSDRGPGAWFSNWGTCPHCHKRGVTMTKSGLARKHKEEK